MSYPFLNRCNGYSLPSSNFTDETVAIFNAHYNLLKEHAKQLLSETYKDIYFGHRFHNPSSVLGRIESAAWEHEFLNDIDEWILDGMRDCALADHWYMFEKDYGE